MADKEHQTRARRPDVYVILLEEIENGTLKPGQPLREIELSERLGVSRTPIRDALKRLEARGIVTHEPFHGALVTKLDAERIAELYFVREILEGSAARLAAIHATDTEVELLRDLIEGDRRDVNGQMDAARRNRIFHEQLHLAARNEFLHAQLRNLHTSIMLLGPTTLRFRDRGAVAIEEHSDVVEAIAQRDPDKAERLARQHIRSALAVRMQLLGNESITA